MSPHDIFAKDYGRGSTIVLGQKLLPVSIGHMALLDGLGVQWDSQGNHNITKPSGLMACVLVLSNTVDGFERLTTTWWNRPLLSLWKWRSLRVLRDRNQLLFRIKIVADHLRDGIETFNFQPRHVESGSTVKSCVPALQRLRVFGQSVMRYPRNIDDMPVRQVTNDYYTWLEQEGMGSMLDISRDDLFAEAKRLAKEEAA